ncbi:phage holin family protein [Saxibacter everestensis]|uniref:Phage holin family protein n=1 Tax=Saxibacter everestensis TaxID=2909229 RepID=A0ABY8QRQ3_9MICO|nr:phage holin family protein [Brevibacteriaceae bacterium ZFBP1038]
MAERSLSELFTEIRNDGKALAADEASLAKAELTAGAKKLGIGGGFLVVAGVLAFLMLIILLIAAAAGLHALGFEWWSSFLLVAAALLLLALLLVAVGLPLVKKAKLNPTRAIAGAKTSIASLQNAAKNPGGPRL